MLSPEIMGAFQQWEKQAEGQVTRVGEEKRVYPFYRPYCPHHSGSQHLYHAPSVVHTVSSLLQLPCGRGESRAMPSGFFNGMTFRRLYSQAQKSSLN